MNIKYSYAEDGDGTFNIIKTTTDRNFNQNSSCVVTVDNKGSAEMIVSELNTTSTTRADDLDLYEIYIYNPEDITEGVYEGRKAGTVSGWDIKWILSTDDHIFNYPFFDCIITKNDGTAAHRSGAILFPS